LFELGKNEVVALLIIICVNLRNSRHLRSKLIFLTNKSVTV